MAIGLLNCDHVSDQNQGQFQDYPQMFKSLLPSLEFKVYHVCDGEFPKDVDECDAYVVGGSKASVYNFVDWIEELKEFILEIYWSGKPYIGVCFGHQILASSLGGVVEKAKAGWNVGLHDFTILQKEPWMDPPKDSFKTLMMCQDQVVKLPENSFHLASSENCPIAMFRVGIRMVGIQSHPEFSNDYVSTLLKERVERIGKEKVDQAMDSLKADADRELLTKWMTKFLEKKVANNAFINLV